jgi:hypothetical protein
MTDPVTVGTLTASALAIAGRALLGSFAGESAKDLCRALKEKVAGWNGGDVKAPEDSTTSADWSLHVAKAVDGQSASDREAVRILAIQLVDAVKGSGSIGLDIGRLEALEVQLGAISVASGTGARIGEMHVLGTFKTGNIEVNSNVGKP